MKKISISETEKCNHSNVCSVTEYNFNDKDIDISILEVSGRFPENGFCMNTKVKEMVYVESGSGNLCSQNESIKLEAGSAILIKPNEMYYWNGNFKALLACSPAWQPDQHKIIAPGKFALGAKVKIEIDRPLGSAHPKFPQTIYPVNYGYIEGVVAPDGDYQDVYLLGVDKPVKEYDGVIIAIVTRDNDIEEKWVAAPEGIKFSKEEIEHQINFMEQYYKSHICMTLSEYESQKKGN